MKLRIPVTILVFFLVVAATACGESSSDASTPIIVQGPTRHRGGDHFDDHHDCRRRSSRPPPLPSRRNSIRPMTASLRRKRIADGEFFDSVGEFFQCLTTEGYGFLGLPNDGDEADPVNDPGYGQALGSCAASTQIVNKMQASQDNSDLTAEEIEEQNRGFGAFVDCLTGRGWTIPPLTPDEDGVLQPSYIEMVQTWETPEGAAIVGDGGLQVDDFVGCGFNPLDTGGTES